MSTHLGRQPLIGSGSKIWRAESQMEVPKWDVVTFAFANFDSCDQEKPIFVNGNDPAECLSARDVRGLVQRMVSGLKWHGLKDGDCVCVHAYNSIWYPSLWLGVIGAGGRVAGSNPAYALADLVHHFKVTDTKYVIVQADHFEAAVKAANECQIPTSHVYALDGVHGQTSHSRNSWRALLDCGEKEWKKFTDVGDYGPKSIAVHAVTSGTTGLPKAAGLSHHYVVAQGTIVEEQYRARTYQVSQVVCLPVFHAFAAQLGLLLPIRTGITTYFIPRFTAEGFARVVSTFSVTDTAVVPPIITALLRLDSSRQHLLRSLRYIVCAGASMNASAQAEMYKCLSVEAIVAQCWGATELGWVTLFDWREKDTSGSVGRLLPNTELKIVDECGNVVTQEGIRGEACIRSQSMFCGYRNNCAANALAFDEEGFYYTGDRVFIRDKKVYIDGRIKDIMKVNGLQVSPEELEAVLLRHPLIHDAAVVGVTKTNDVGIELTMPRAYVVRSLGVKKLNEEDVKTFVAGKVTSYKRLSGGVCFVPTIPRASTGKILRRLLASTEEDGRADGNQLT